jgi:hypothetical protein
MARPPRRIFARRTVCRKIEATVARSFLTQHHLWGATKARYSYGLFQEPQLVAVATFSKCRRVHRDAELYHSYELIRYCSRKESTVVGGISKLWKQFVRDRKNDHPSPKMDLVTMVDRDWGAATGWEDALNFHSMAVLDPLVMVVGGKDKQRRYLVGAGLQHDQLNEETTRRQEQSGLRPRLGLTTTMLQDLNATRNPTEALHRLASEDLFPVYDAGVERLYMLVDTPSSTQNVHPRETEGKTAKILWQTATPKYTTRYYSSNAGVVSLLEYAAIGSPPLDAPIHQEAAMSWKMTSAGDEGTTLVFEAPSSMDNNATIEICQRRNGWRTMRFVRDAAKTSQVSSIYHGIWKVNPSNNEVDLDIVVQEHLKTMAVLALMAGHTTMSNNDSGADTDDNGRGQGSLRFLHFGYGAGTLVRFLAHRVKCSQHVVVELDQGVVDAIDNVCPAMRNVSLIVQDAVQYVQLFHSQRREQQYDCICVDVFDENNLVPEQLYSVAILEAMRDKLLAANGTLVWNFHSGGKRRTQVIQAASGALSVAFGNSFCWIPSIDSTVTGGNLLLLASKPAFPDDGGGTISLSRMALSVQMTAGLTFDAVARVSKVERG